MVNHSPRTGVLCTYYCQAFVWTASDPWYLRGLHWNLWKQPIERLYLGVCWSPSLCHWHLLLQERGAGWEVGHQNLCLNQKSKIIVTQGKQNCPGLYMDRFRREILHFLEADVSSFGTEEWWEQCTYWKAGADGATMFLWALCVWWSKSFLLEQLRGVHP